MVLIPALLLTAIVDAIFRGYAPEILAGNLNSVSNSFPMLGAYSGSISTFIGNLFFLQNIYTPVFGINGPLWSLANEFWYYVLFPLIFLSLGKFGNYQKAPLRLAGLVILGVVLVALPTSFMEGFLIWLMGAGVYALARTISKARRWVFLIGSLGLGGLSLLYTKLDSWQLAMGLPQDLILGMGFSAICLITATWTKPNKSMTFEIPNKVSFGISEFSYSLYLSHFPFVALISVFIFQSKKMLPNTLNIFFYSYWLMLLFGIGVVYWYIFERHTNFIKSTLLKINLIK